MSRSFSFYFESRQRHSLPLWSLRKFSCCGFWGVVVVAAAATTVLSALTTGFISSVRTGIVGFVLHYSPSISYMRTEKWKEWRNELYINSPQTVFQRLLEVQQNSTRRTYLNCTGLAGHCDMLAVLAFRKPMQKDLEFKASLSVNKLPFQSSVPKLGCQGIISRLERGRGPWVHNVPHTALQILAQHKTCDNYNYCGKQRNHQRETFPVVVRPTALGASLLRLIAPPSLLLKLLITTSQTCQPISCGPWASLVGDSLSY